MGSWINSGSKNFKYHQADAAMLPIDQLKHK